MQRQLQTYDAVRALDADAARRVIRASEYVGQTAGLALGRLQTNLVILPETEARDFADYCRFNPKPCPVVAMGEAGNPVLAALGDVDVRTDASGYSLYARGMLQEQMTDISAIWRDDLVAFAIGCSFTFERALMAEDIPMRHIDQNKTVPMFRTTVETRPAGPFGGGLVVSMRPVPEQLLAKVISITERYPQAHGAPVHVGDPRAIGIADVMAPDWGDAVVVGPGEVPVFWACGVTPQNALAQAKPAFCITHTPGHMLITDLDECAPTKADAGSTN